MSLQERDSGFEQTAAEFLAERTDRPVEDFEYDGEVPDAIGQEWHLVEDGERRR